ncbi:plasminogen-binding N-terminal domain-containing protein [Sulfurovum sp. XGS-02]|uniref:plasminogen-binding N-terminal domain-containing protein n=1 Tax=Sulfurovum sp. XGS-02 TaxID=2925411 RepID=UPI00206A90B0|nr:plasminogen-binding N-terminal domain-containing protein [Sulfurovum sp. XGS-02]UPT77301.1 plasminogen-binding N-terminal domain-containing protein [Sulfurovum sp. XGS-02]
MHKIALIALLSLPLFADFFPQTVNTSVKYVKGDTITLNKQFPVNGMSGVVIHNYGNGLTAITSRIAQTSSNESVALVSKDILHHDKLPTIKTPISVKDKVIGGYLYNNVLLLAPDADTYAKITSEHTKKWIHPDLFALYLSVEGEEKPTRENLARFAKKYQVGLVYIVRKNSAVLLDPISEKIVSEKSMKGLPAKGSFPFYMRFKQRDSGWFGSDVKGNYYHTMKSL